MRELQGKTALVTGASRGIGMHLACALAERGMNLALVARSGADLARVKARLEPRGVRVLCTAVDISDRAALRSLVDKVLAEFGAIELLVNSAGLDQVARYPDHPDEDIARVIDVNLTAPMLLTHIVLPHMLARGEGHVVNIASVAGLMGVPYNEAYAASKHGLLGFTRSLAATADGEGWPLGFSCILPGFIAGSGMYDTMKREAGRKLPPLSGVTQPHKVVSETLTAIERGRLEVVVNPVPLKPLVIFLLLFPAATRWALRATGVIKWFRAAATGRQRGLDEVGSPQRRRERSRDGL